MKPSRMTAVSCVLIGLAFFIAVGLLVVAGVGLGWLVPLLLARGKPRKDRDAV